jgi:phage RecT family recombinase
MNAITTAPADMFALELDALKDKLIDALPDHIAPERFKRAAVTAVMRDPGLLAGNLRHSLFLACCEAAEDGLYPDKREGAFVIMGGKVTWMPMVAGLIKLAWNSGVITAIHVDIAYEGEQFEVWSGTDPRIIHRHDLTAMAKGFPAMLAAYAVISLTSGEKQMEVLSFNDVKRIKAVSKAQNGPWVAWWDEMSKVRALKRALKRLPLSIDRDIDARLLRAAKRADEIDTAPDDDVVPTGSAAAPALTHETRLDALEAALAKGDPELVVNGAIDAAPGTLNQASEADFQGKTEVATGTLPDAASQAGPLQEYPEDAPPDPDIDWAAEFCGNIRQCKSGHEIDFLGKNIAVRRKMDDLATKRPDLFEQLRQASQRRRAELAPQVAA